MNKSHGPITTLIHASVYLSHQYRAAKRDQDEPRAQAVKLADRIIIDAKEKLYRDVPQCEPVGVRL